MTASFEEELPATSDDTETVPDSMAEEFSSLSTPFCWVITEDLVAGYDGLAPSEVGSYGPPDAALADVQEALRSGRWFRLIGKDGQPCAVGRNYDPSGDNEDAPLQQVGYRVWGATVIEYRHGGNWEPVAED